MSKIGHDVIGKSEKALPDKVALGFTGGVGVGFIKDIQELVNLAKKLYKRHKVESDDIVYGILPDKTVGYTIVGTWTGAKMDVNEFRDFVREQRR